MSINSAMNAGVAGLQANSTALAILSDNIANVNTVGYKQKMSDFAMIVTANQSVNAHSAGGVIPIKRALVNEQGLLQGTASSTDLGISGDGFFVVSDDTTAGGSTSTFVFTRAGSFAPDDQGFLRNSAGYYLRGWPVASNGTVVSNPSDLSLLEAVNIDNLGGTAEQTTTVQLNANLLASQAISPAEATYNPAVSANNMASGTVTPDFQASVQIFDSKGGFRTVTYSFLKSTAPNEWHTEVHVVPTSDINTSFVDGQIATGTLAFTQTGQVDFGATTLPTTLDFLASGVAPGAGQFAWASGLGISGQTVALDLGVPGGSSSFTQFDSPSALISSQVDGAVFGNLTGVRIDEQGFVIALFDNGIQRQIYQIPTATFVNANGLQEEQGNSYSVTDDSGTFTLKVAGTGGAGTIAANTLEASTVDLADEFTGLIKTQRAYSASTKIITTADEMLEELIRIKR